MKKLSGYDYSIDDDGWAEELAHYIVDNAWQLEGVEVESLGLLEKALYRLIRNFKEELI